MTGRSGFRLEKMRAARSYAYINQVAPSAACVRPCFTVTMSVLT